MANSVDPDQTAGSTLFAQACLSENLGSLQYVVYHTLNASKKADVMANSIDTDHENFGSLWFVLFHFQLQV